MGSRRRHHALDQQIAGLLQMMAGAELPPMPKGTPEETRAAARYAAATAADDHPDRRVAASLAQAYCSEVAVSAAEECVQLHGGIGVTWEHPTHLYLKRAKADQIAFGTAGAHRLRLSELVDLPSCGA